MPRRLGGGSPCWSHGGRPRPASRAGRPPANHAHARGGLACTRAASVEDFQPSRASRTYLPPRRRVRLRPARSCGQGGGLGSASNHREGRAASSACGWRARTLPNLPRTGVRDRFATPRFVSDARTGDSVCRDIGRGGRGTAATEDPPRAWPPPRREPGSCRPCRKVAGRASGLRPHEQVFHYRAGRAASCRARRRSAGLELWGSRSRAIRHSRLNHRRWAENTALCRDAD